MISYLEEWLGNYKVYTNGTKVVFESELEEYHGEFSLRLQLENVFD